MASALRTEGTMDTSLVERAQHGDESAFTALVLAIGDRFQALAHRILRDVDMAEDATQQALLSIWRDLPTLRDPSRFDGWSYRILVRACRAQQRSRSSLYARSVLAYGGVESDRSAQIVDRDELERAFTRLSVDHRAVVALRYYLDLTIEQSAEMLGIPVGTATSRLHYAVKALRASIEADGRAAAQGATR